MCCMSQGSPGEEAAKCQEDRAAEGKVGKVDAAKPQNVPKCLKLERWRQWRHC